MPEQEENTQKTDKPWLFKPWCNPWPWRPKGQRTAATIFKEAIMKIEKDQKIEDVERDLIMVILAKAKKWDLRAMEMYLDRMYWKPKQEILSTIVDATSELELWE